MKKTILVLSVVYLLNACSVIGGMPSARFDFTVVDEENRPIEGATVAYYFRIDSNQKVGWGVNTDEDKKEKTTNKDGFASESGKTNNPVMMGSLIDKAGYYGGFSGFPEKDKVWHNKLLNRWEPYPCEIKIVLRKIKNPVPMYVKKIHAMRHPQKDMFVGYDLEIGDWVSPYGKGKINDFIFELKTENKDPFNGEANLKLRFANKNDGIIKYDQSIRNSDFRWPYEAIVKEYQKELFKFRHSKKGEKTNQNFNSGDFYTKYIFRVRTKINEQGNITSANYGYIDSDFTCSQWNEISFIYYFNPDNKSRSLEFNGKNLFEKEDKSSQYEVRDATPEEIKEWEKSKKL